MLVREGGLFVCLFVYLNPVLGCVCVCYPPCAGALQIEHSEESDQGKYECVATNNDGTRYSAPANLYVRGRRTEP